MTLVGEADARRLRDFYAQQARWLRFEQGGVGSTSCDVTNVTSRASVADQVAEPSHVESVTEAELTPAPVAPNLAPSVAEPAREADAGEHAEVALEVANAPSIDARVVDAASSWSRVWKPFLTDSVGWFIGGFLIVAGVAWWVGDAWGEMTSLGHALTVFGLAAGWSLAFRLWASVLLRKPATEPAGRMVERLSMVMAPVAPAALGSLEEAWLFWPLLLGWSGVVGWLAASATRRLSLSPVQPFLALGSASVLVGCAPVVAEAGIGIVWLTAIPVGLAAWSFSRGPHEHAATFLVPLFGWATGLSAIALFVASSRAGTPAPFALLAPLLAAFLGSTVWLSDSRRAGDPVSVGVVLTQAVLTMSSLDWVAPKPAFVVTALVTALTALGLSRRRISERSARWLPVAAAFGFVAYQRLDQLVPAVVLELYVELKARLGYSSQALPASYGAVTATFFVVLVGLVAERWSRRPEALARHEGRVLLDTTAVSAIAASGLALLTLPTDSRPALVAMPMVLVAMTWLVARTQRLLLTVAGTLAACVLAAAIDVSTHSLLGGSLVALGLTGLTFVTERHQRLSLSLGAGLLSLFSLGSSLLITPAASSVVTALIASIALLLVVRAHHRLLAAAAVGPFVVTAVLGRWLSPASIPLLLALGAVVANALALRIATFRVGRVAAALAVLIALLWQPLVWSSAPMPGLTVLACAVAIFLFSKTEVAAAGPALEALAIALAMATLLPGLDFPVRSPLTSMGLAALVGALAGVHALLRGRTWRTSWLAASAVVVTALSARTLDPGSLVMLFMLIVFVTPALVAEVTIPLAAATALLFTWAHVDSRLAAPVLSLLALGTALIGLLDPSGWARAFLAKRRPAWAASLSSAALLGASCLADTEWPLLRSVVLLATPLLWARALRWPLVRLLSVLLAWSAPLAAPVVAWVLTVERGADIRDRRFMVVLVSVTAFVASLTTANPMVWASWLLALWTMPVGALGVRLVLASALAALLGPTTTTATLVALLGAGLAIRHAPSLVSRVLGANSLAWVPACASGASVVLAAVCCVTSPGGVSHGALVMSLVLMALTVGVAPALAAAIVLACLDVPQLVLIGAPTLSTWALPVAGVTSLAAVLLQGDWLRAKVEAWWARLGVAGDGLTASVWWAGATLVVGSLVQGASPGWLAVSALLMVSTSRVETLVGALLFFAAANVLIAPLTMSAPVALVGLLLVVAGVRSQGGVGPARQAAGAALGLAALTMSTQFDAWPLPVVWSLAACTAWVLAREWAALRWVGWAMSLAASHVVLGFVGNAVSSGAPQALILPWWALATTVLALLAGTGRTSRVLQTFALVELTVAAALVPAHGFELLPVVATTAFQLWLGVRGARLGSPSSVWLAAGALTAGTAAGCALGEVATGLLSVSVLLVALAAVSLREALPVRPAVGAALRRVAVWWPVMGALATPWASVDTLVVVLVATAAHYAVAARAMRDGAASVLAALVFNVAMATLWFGHGWREPQYLLVPLGASALVLIHLFGLALDQVLASRVRALAISLVYAGVAFRPLAIDDLPLFFLCVTVCVAGVAVGIGLRLRSFVSLGSVFLVTTVVATLGRWGIREPRLGALFLSTLGLAIVAFMVLVTTKRTALLERYKRVRSALERMQA